MIINSFSKRLLFAVQPMHIFFVYPFVTFADATIGHGFFDDVVFIYDPERVPKSKQKSP